MIIWRERNRVGLRILRLEDFPGKGTLQNHDKHDNIQGDQPNNQEYADAFLWFVHVFLDENAHFVGSNICAIVLDRVGLCAEEGDLSQP